MAENNELSAREIEILKLVATGASNKEIAHELTISANTVKVHLRNVFAKIGVASRTEAAMYAVRQGFVETPGGNASQANGPLPVSSSADGSLVPKPEAMRWGIIIVVLSVLLGVLLIGLRTVLPASQAESFPEPASLPRWEVQAEMPQARAGLTAVAYDGRIFAIGGESPEDTSAQVWVYDPQADNWSELAPLPSPVSGIGAAVIGGKIYVPGGVTSGGVITDRVAAFDPSENRWTQVASLPRPLAHYALVAYEGKLLLFGGWDGQKYRSEVYAYDPDDDSWQERSAMPDPRAEAGAALLGERILVLGGRNAGGTLAGSEYYSPAAESRGDSPWEAGPELPEGRKGLGVVSIANILYVIGGEGDGQEGLPSLQYLAEKKSWQAFDAPFLRGWSDFGLAAVGSDLYVLGGRLDNLLLQNNMAYQAIYTVSIPIVR